MLIPALAILFSTAALAQEVECYFSLNGQPQTPNGVRTPAPTAPPEDVRILQFERSQLKITGHFGALDFLFQSGTRSVSKTAAPADEWVVLNLQLDNGSQGQVSCISFVN